MENQIHFRTQKQVIEWLFFIVNSREEYESLLCDYSRITGLNIKNIERRLRIEQIRKNEKLTTN